MHSRLLTHWTRDNFQIEIKKSRTARIPIECSKVWIYIERMIELLTIRIISRPVLERNFCIKKLKKKRDKYYFERVEERKWKGSRWQRWNSLTRSAPIDSKRGGSEALEPVSDFRPYFLCSISTCARNPRAYARTRWIITLYRASFQSYFQVAQTLVSRDNRAKKRDASYWHIGREIRLAEDRRQSLEIRSGFQNRGMTM